MTQDFTSRQFNQDIARAKRAAKDGPVFITDRGRPSHVLLSIEEYRRIREPEISLAAALAQKQGADLAFEPPRLGEGWLRPAEFD